MKHILWVCVLCLLIVMPSGAQQDAGWTTHNGDTLSLRAPAAWVALGGGEVDSGLQLLALSNPTLHDFNVADYDLYLLDITAGVSVNVTSTAIRTAPDLRDVMGTLAEAYNRTGLNVQDAALVTLPAGAAGRFILAPRTLTPDEVSYVTQQYQYVIYDAGRLHFVTMTAPPETFDEFAATFERIANTIQINDGVRGWSRYRGTSLAIRVPPGWESRSPGQNVQIALGLPDDSARLALSRTPLQDPIPTAEIRDLLDASYTEQGREVVALDIVTLPAGDFVRGHTVYTRDDNTLAQFQYAGVIGTDYVTATFTVSADLAEGYALLFAQIMDTLRLD